MANATCSMKSLKVKYCASGGTAVLKSAGAQSLLASNANRMASNCNAIASGTMRNARNRPSYVAEPGKLKWTSGYVIHPDNVEGYVANLKHNILRKGCNL